MSDPIRTLRTRFLTSILSHLFRLANKALVYSVASNYQDTEIGGNSIDAWPGRPPKCREVDCTHTHAKPLFC